MLGLPIKFWTPPLAARLSKPVDGHSLAMLRIVFGIVGAFSMIRILANGWIESLYAGPARHFTYPGFKWVHPPEVEAMYLLVCVVGLAALCVAVGWHFRISMTVFWLGFGWIEFIDVTTYLNHYWFVSLVGLLMLFAPMTNELAPRADRRSIALGWVWLFRFQIAVVYCFAGLAKLNSDWLVHAMPLRLWLPTRTNVAVIGSLLDQRWIAYAFSWAGAAFDCTIVGFLLWRRTRLAAWLVVIAFHVATWRLFSIGVFPWLMIGVTTVFFDPSWPRRLVQRLRCDRALNSPSSEDLPTASQARSRPRFVLPIALIWVVFQVLIPLRHLGIDGDYRWTGEGYRWSWNVLATERGGDVSFRITDSANGRTWTTAAVDRYTPLQWKAMSTDAELIRQAAHSIADDYASEGLDVEVRVDAFVSLNGRRATRLIDPTVDLARQPWRIGHQPWILPAPTSTSP